MSQIYFVIEGAFGLYHPTLKVKGNFGKKDVEPAVLMPRHTVYGDYQLLFDLYPLMDLCPFLPSSTTPQEIVEDLGEDAKVDYFKCMCLNVDVL